MSETAIGDIRVLDLAGPIGVYCTKLPADLGADVIKIERPRGTPPDLLAPSFMTSRMLSLYWFQFNTNKRSITLNLETTDVERYLVKGKPTYHGDWALFHKTGYEMWKDLATALRPPKPKGMYNHIKDDPNAARAMTVAGYYSSIKAGQKFAREYDLYRYSLLLDLGGGSGVYSIMACQQYPNLRAIALDYPHCLRGS